MGGYGYIIGAVPRVDRKKREDYDYDAPASAVYIESAAPRVDRKKREDYDYDYDAPASAVYIESAGPRDARKKREVYDGPDHEEIKASAYRWYGYIESAAPRVDI